MKVYFILKYSGVNCGSFKNEDPGVELVLDSQESSSAPWCFCSTMDVNPSRCQGWICFSGCAVMSWHEASPESQEGKERRREVMICQMFTLFPLTPRLTRPSINLHSSWIVIYFMCLFCLFLELSGEWSSEAQKRHKNNCSDLLWLCAF